MEGLTTCKIRPDARLAQQNLELLCLNKVFLGVLRFVQAGLGTEGLLNPFGTENL